MVTGSYLSIITLNINGLNAPKKKTKASQMDTKTELLFMLPTRDPPHTQGHIQAEIKGLGKGISCKWKIE